MVQAALDAGLTYLDTAPLYGHGTAERRVGAALSGIGRSEYVLSSKVGRLIVPVEGADGGGGPNANGYADAPPSEATFDYTRDGILRSVTESLERLGLDRVDVLYIHDPDDHERRPSRWPTRGPRAARPGRGAGDRRGHRTDPIPTRFVRETDINAVLLAGRYTLLEQPGAEDLLPACLERDTSVVIGGVYNSGLLADPRPGATYNYAEAPAHLIARAQELAGICERHGVPLKAAAIQFPLWHPAVATILTGARSVAELEENLAMMEYDVPDALWDDLADAGVKRYGA